ncbi:MAG: hypothetical protein RSA21_10140, partial [Akkermansia sp.]
IDIAAPFFISIPIAFYGLLNNLSFSLHGGIINQSALRVLRVRWRISGRVARKSSLQKLMIDNILGVNSTKQCYIIDNIKTNSFVYYFCK